MIVAYFRCISLGGMLPYEGALMDQTNGFVRMFDSLQVLHNAWKAEEDDQRTNQPKGYSAPASHGRR